MSIIAIEREAADPLFNIFSLEAGFPLSHFFLRTLTGVHFAVFTCVNKIDSV